LRFYLQTLLDKHIERELPKVRLEVKKLTEGVEMKIMAFGEERPTSGHRRMFLSRLAMQFHSLASCALNGTYHEADPVFFGEPQTERSTRLRAIVHQHNSKFADYMRINGQKRKIMDFKVDHPISQVASVDGSKAESNMWDTEQLLVT